MFDLWLSYTRTMAGKVEAVRAGSAGGWPGGGASTRDDTRACLRMRDRSE